MLYRWDAGVVTADDEIVVETGEQFWGRTPSFALGEEQWRFRNDPEGLIGALNGTDRLGIDRGRIWQSTWAMAGLRGPLTLTRTTSWLFGKLYFDVARNGERIAEVIPEGPWQYRPSLEVTGELAPVEAVFVLWAAARIDGRRPQRVIRADGISAGGGAS